MKRWTVRLGEREHTGVPLSAEAVRVFEAEVLAAMGRPADQQAALFRLLRKTFPLRWRVLWDGDPVRQWMAHPQREQLLLQYLTLPAKVEPPKVMDEWDRLEAMQRVPEVPDPNAPKVSLDTICGLVEVEAGAGWYYAPYRWPTVDGYAPYDAVFRMWGMLTRARALGRLNHARAIGITQAGDKAAVLWQADVKEALGG
jgi:hypothetical protein